MIVNKSSYSDIRPITVVGSVTTDPNDPVFPGCMVFNSTPRSRVTAYISNDIISPPKDFTIEFNFITYSLHTAENINAFVAFSNESNFTAGFLIRHFSANRLEVYTNAVSNIVSNNVMLNTWYHFALCRKFNQFFVYLDGVLIAVLDGAYAFHSQSNLSAQLLSIGGSIGGRWLHNGKIANFRITTDVARYHVLFTPVTNGKIDNDTVDQFPVKYDDTNYHSMISGWAPVAIGTLNDQTVFNRRVTRSGTALPVKATILDKEQYVMRFGSAGSSSLNTDVSFNSILSNRDYTVELWYRPLSKVSTSPYIVCNGSAVNSTNGFQICERNDGISVADYRNKFVAITGSFNDPDLLASQTVVEDGNWYHIAVTKRGNMSHLFINGILEHSIVNNRVNTLLSDRFSFGRYEPSPSNSSCHGDIAQFRVSHFARYTDNFTPSNYLTFDSGAADDPHWDSTGLLITNDNGVPVNISDYTHVVTTTGSVSMTDENTAIIANGSIRISDRCEWLKSNTYQNFNTIEFSFKAPVFGQINGASVLYNHIYEVSNWTNGISIQVLSNNTLRFNRSNENIGSVGIQPNVWNHLAFVRMNNNAFIFLDGVLVHGFAITTVYTENQIIFGNSFNNSYPFNGEMKNIRITSGVARYRRNFVVPDIITRDTVTILSDRVQIFRTTVIVDLPNDRWITSLSGDGVVIIPESPNYVQVTRSGNQFTLTQLTGVTYSNTPVNGYTVAGLPEIESVSVGTNTKNLVVSHGNDWVHVRYAGINMAVNDTVTFTVTFKD